MTNSRIQASFLRLSFNAAALVLFFILCPLAAQTIPAEYGKDIFSAGAQQSDSSAIYLVKVTGNLYITRPDDVNSKSEAYDVYFHIPVSFADQVPLYIEINGEHVRDYRFIRLGGHNIIVAAHINPCWTTGVLWTAWVLVRDNRYTGLPDYVPMPDRSALPDSVLPWLESTDCVQSDALIVKETADEVRAGTDNLVELAENISEFCKNIPWVAFPAVHEPIAFDAVYTLNWGSSCTGHANAGAALFRANGIPARVLLNVLSLDMPMDHHWAIEYFMPDYGWVRLETTLGIDRVHPVYNIVTMACSPADEFPLFRWNGIENQWHTSDPALGYRNPDWKGSHRAVTTDRVTATSDTADMIFSLAGTAFSRLVQYTGINLEPSDSILLDNATELHYNAFLSAQTHDIAGCVDNLVQSTALYNDIHTEPYTTIFFDDFEHGPGSWISGGLNNAWQIGSPGFGPDAAFSGTRCRGVNLNGPYPANADCWLSTRPVYLTGYRCAFLDFRVWNSVEEGGLNTITDPFWIDITNDGTTFYPLCSHMGGVNDDPEIFTTGGWSRVCLDLSTFLGDTVQVRFRFQSNESVEKAGPYIDDVHIYGIYESGADTTQPVDSKNPENPVFTLMQNYENPFIHTTTITYIMHMPAHVHIAVYDIRGRHVADLVNETKDYGTHHAELSGSGLSSGVYVYRMQAGGCTETRKCTLLAQ